CRTHDLSPSRHVERDAVDDVVMIAGRIVVELGRLRLADLVGGARHYDHFALAPERRREGAERIFPQILAELGRRPGLATIGRDLDRRDAVASVPGNSA